jgi:hypothetical protein
LDKVVGGQGRGEDAVDGQHGHLEEVQREIKRLNN